MPTAVHFEIHATDPDAARTFYGALFGWTFEQFGEMSYWLIRTGGGQGRDGGLLLRGTDAPEAGRSPNAFVVTFDVEDCDATVASAVAAGAGVAMPADDMPGVGRLAYLIDPDGNLFGVLQPAM
jgi:predicted enzyme related to lactoylglutathione lyase